MCPARTVDWAFLDDRGLPELAIATNIEKRTDAPGFGKTIGIACLIGLAGGSLFGVWDSIGVLVMHAPRPIAVSEGASLSLYAVSVYAAIGGLSMAVLGAIAASVVRVSGYQPNGVRLSQVFLGLFVFMAVFLVFSPSISNGPTFQVIEVSVVALLSGAGVAGLGHYILAGLRGGQKLTALSISLVATVVALAYGGVWLNFGLLHEEGFLRPVSLLADAGLLVVSIMLGAGLYALSLSILRRYRPRALRRAGILLLVLGMCGFVAVSVVGPITFGHNRPAETAAGTARDGGISPTTLSGKPNVLWIVMDTVRADRLSSYGHYRNTTPNIDRVASEGALFRNAMSTAPWTLPSHASMFTGLYPGSHGADAEHQWLDDDFLTLAEVLRAHGWETYGYTNNYFAGPRANIDQGFDTFVVGFPDKAQLRPELTSHLRVSIAGRNAQSAFRQDDGADRTNEAVKRWIADATRAGVPFFVFINYMEAHAPYRPPKEFVVPFLDADTSFEDAMSVNQDYYVYISGKLEMDDEDFEVLSAVYDGALAYLDFKIGQLVDYLRELGALDSTVVIITSDHGESLGEHNLMGHQLSVYDTLLNVPLIIRYPDAFDPGTLVREGVQQVDLLPTVLDIVGIDGDGIGHQGRSLLQERSGLESRPLVAEYAILGNMLELLTRANPSFDVSSYTRQLKAIRTEEFKYIWSSDGRDELYNIRQDPGELNNLIASEPEKAREMKDLLDEWLGSFESYRARIARETRTATVTARR